MQFIDANYVAYQPGRFLSYDDVSLVVKYSDHDSRNDRRIDLTTKFTSMIPLRVPILSAPMDTVTGPEMVKALAQQGAFGILHRTFENEDARIAAIKEIASVFGAVAFSIGTDNTEAQFVAKITEMLPNETLIVNIDVAHGHLEKCMRQIRNVKSIITNKSQIIAGNIVTGLAAKDLITAGANAIRVGIGNGGNCKTRQVTGHGTPQLSAIMECRRAINAIGSNAALIADGGIRNSGDIVKALAVGADSVMIGRLFAATEESPGKLHFRRSDGEYIKNSQDSDYYEDKLYKKYRGQSSQDFLNTIGKTGVAPEGESCYIPYRGSVTPILTELIMGIKSGMTYAGCHTLAQLNEHATFIEVSYNGYIEGTPHGIDR